MSKSEDEIEIKPLEEQKTVDRRTPVVRERLAIGLMVIVPVTIIAALVAAAVSHNAATIKEIAVVVIPPLIVALSGILGFYFGTKQR